MFEYLIGDLLKKIGYENVDVTKRSNDGGVDILADLTMGGLTDVRTIIQVKRFKSTIDVKVIRELRGSAEVGQRGLVITTSGFKKTAIEEAQAPKKMPVSLVDGEKLLDLMFQYGVGIKKEEKVIYTLDEDYFDSEIGSPLEKKISDKNRGIWPLPGGTGGYVESLDKLLQAIKDGINTNDKLVAWFLKNFENVNSDKTSGGYARVPRTMGLVNVENGIFFLSEEGEHYLKSKDVDFLFEVINKYVFGFEEILEFLSFSEEPQKEQDILDYLSENHDVEWTTFAQVTFRLMWLMNLGRIKKIDKGYIVKNNGGENNGVYWPRFQPSIFQQPLWTDIIVKLLVRQSRIKVIRNLLWPRLKMMYETEGGLI